MGIDELKAELAENRAEFMNYLEQVQANAVQEGRLRVCADLTSVISTLKSQKASPAIILALLEQRIGDLSRDADERIYL